MDTATTDREHDAYAALKIPAYRAYFIANLIAILGMQMQTTAVGWDIYERTDSKLALGYVGLVQFLPSVLLTLVTGQVADRVPRRLVLACSVLTIAIASAGLAWISYRQLDDRLIFVCLFAIGVARSFVIPAKAALLPQLLPLKLFSNAVTWNSSSFHLASVLGPAIGGFLISYWGGATRIYVLDVYAALYFVFMICTIRLPPAEPRAPSASPLQELVAGINFVRKNQIILGSISLDMFAVLLGGATTLLPVYAEDILKTGPVGLGWMRAAPAIGALLMAIVLAHRPPMARAGQALLWSIVGFGVATIIFGLSRNYFLSLSMLFLTGAFDNVSVVIRHTLVQTLTPNAIRGRVSAVNGLFIGASNELGGYESGLVAHFFGTVASVVSGGVGTILIVMAAAATLPRLRDYGRLGSTESDEPQSSEKMAP
ncbi:MAG: MFS transporter [Planctomycetota bacterium]|nr:MFS transporter [Planctomycetota bacterium]